MWGSDYPHDEGTFPYTREASVSSSATSTRPRCAALLGGNAADLYGFDLAALAPIAGGSGRPWPRCACR